MGPDRAEGIAAERLYYREQISQSAEAFCVLLKNFPPLPVVYGVDVRERDTSSLPLLTPSGLETVISFEPSMVEQWHAEPKVKAFIEEIGDPYQLETSVILERQEAKENEGGKEEGHYALLFRGRRGGQDTVTVGISSDPNKRLHVVSSVVNGKATLPAIVTEYRSILSTDTEILRLLAQGSKWLSTVLSERLMIMDPSVSANAFAAPASILPFKTRDQREAA